MNHPYPSRQALRIEDAADALMAEQAAATAAFRTIAIAARTALAALEFPLGSPARDYDIADIEGALGDWLAARPDDALRAEAMEIAAAEYADDRAEWARDAVNDNAWFGEAS